MLPRITKLLHEKDDFGGTSPIKDGVSVEIGASSGVGGNGFGGINITPSPNVDPSVPSQGKTGGGSSAAVSQQGPIGSSPVQLIEASGPNGKRGSKNSKQGSKNTNKGARGSKE